MITRIIVSIAALIASQSLLAKEHIEWVWQAPAYKQSSQAALGASLNIGLAHGGLPNQAVQRGYYGFGVSLKQNFYLTPRNLLGYELAINTHDKTSFVSTRGTLTTASLWDVSTVATYNYRISPQFSVGLASGLGLVWGNGVGFFLRFSPVLGVQSNIQLSKHLTLDISYRHYFGAANHKAYQNRWAAPSIDRLALGVSYVF